jgi:hypothetical protein
VKGVHNGERRHILNCIDMNTTGGSMNTFNTELFRSQIDALSVKLLSYERLAEIHTPADSWTIRDNVAHLIDSAANNHQRFIRLQLSENVVLPGYDAETWVDTAAVKHMTYHDLVTLWKLYNDYLLEVIASIKTECLHHTWQNSDTGEEATLEFIVNDYFRHLKTHEQMIDAIALAASVFIK